MKKPRLFTLIFVPIIWLILLSSIAFVWYANRAARAFYLQQTESTLSQWAELASSLALIPLSNNSSLDSLTRSLDSLSNIRFTFIAEDGRVLADSRQAANLMENHRERPEVRKALAGMKGVAIRSSPTLKQEMMYLALPLIRQGGRGEVIRAAIPLNAIGSTLRSIYLSIALGALGIFFGTIVVSYLIAHRITEPVIQMQNVALRFGAGDFSGRIPSPAPRELAALATTLNGMAQQIRDKIQDETRRRGELNAVLSSMNEGILAIGKDNRILFINHAAERLLGVTASTVVGQSLPAGVRHSGLAEFILSLNTLPPPTPASVGEQFAQSPQTAQFERDGLILEVTGTELTDNNRQKLGTLAVLADVTRLRQLETVRRDFVANVSHELRTPITSIKGSAETLGMIIREDPESASRFTLMILRNSDRMIAILEDLLSLARLEQSDRGETIAMEHTSLAEVTRGALEMIAEKADARGNILSLSGEAEITAGNSQLLEQAVSNLLDNAIKYSSPGTKILVEIALDNQEASITIKDQGAGIEAQHLPRLFERFYRVDTGRSRNEGGTGLGLAIVRHIAIVHGGRVSVASTPGVGSTFGIHLPR